MIKIAKNRGIKIEGKIYSTWFSKNPLKRIEDTYKSINAKREELIYRLNNHGCYPRIIDIFYLDPNNIKILSDRLKYIAERAKTFGTLYHNINYLAISVDQPFGYVNYFFIGNGKIKYSVIDFMREIAIFIVDESVINSLFEVFENQFGDYYFADKDNYYLIEFNKENGNLPFDEKIFNEKFFDYLKDVSFKDRCYIYCLFLEIFPRNEEELMNLFLSHGIDVSKCKCRYSIENYPFYR